MPTIEEAIRQSVHEALVPIAEEIHLLKQKTVAQYPPAVKAKDAAKMLSLGITKVYELAHNPNFYPAIWVDDPEHQTGRVIFSSEAILKWISEHSTERLAKKRMRNELSTNDHHYSY
ncbi:MULTISPECIES: hypothetical protein [unclassified Sporolactobacillus]|uniref:hypothetical protein n=1 Tax=unclassified Sporolactobacillus TaxID=2628533 RepID=UPI002367DCA0|nr:hypothetical protein [Sporolactobacillus sp. CQH2019]MDD9150413.1 hypothetical protein [Sporolactobacillus sp. CQH2019]